MRCDGIAVVARGRHAAAGGSRDGRSDRRVRGGSRGFGGADEERDGIGDETRGSHRLANGEGV